MLLVKAAQRIRGITERITYKPGTTWDVTCKHNEVLVRLIIKTLDAENPDRVTQICYERLINPLVGAEAPINDVLQLLYEMAMHLEMHEVSEWFKVNGRTLSPRILNRSSKYFLMKLG